MNVPDARVHALVLTLLVPAGVPAADTSRGDSGALDGAALFATHCMSCHGIVFAPTPSNLGKLSADDIYAELWRGSMAEIANGLEDAERRAIADYVAGLNPNKQPDGSGARACAHAPSTSSSGAAWAGWAPDTANARAIDTAAARLGDPKDLAVQWAFVFPDLAPSMSGGNQVTVVGDRVYVGSLNRFVYALDAAQGCAHWVFRADGRVRSAVVIADGIAVVADTQSGVYGLDAATGRLLWKARADPQQSARVTGNIAVHAGHVLVPISTLQEIYGVHGRLSCCSFRGAVVALDLKTGARRWYAPMIESPLAYLGMDDNGKPRYGPSGVTVWATPTVDTKRGLVYIATGNQFTGPLVPESDAIIALELETGTRRWIQTLAPEQFGARDIYHIGCEAWVDAERKTCPPENPDGKGDRDFGAPVILQSRSDGRDLLLAGSKDGVLYALDPEAQGAVQWRLRLGRGGETGGIQYGMAADRERVYVPISDVDYSAPQLRADGSLSAVDLTTGKLLWRVPGSTNSCQGKALGCHNAYLSALTVAGNVVYAGNTDAILRAYDARTGAELWQYETYRNFDGVNGLRGKGGSISFGGPAVSGERMFVVSGMGHLGIGMPGNVLLAFRRNE